MLCCYRMGIMQHTCWNQAAVRGSTAGLASCEAADIKVTMCDNIHVTFRGRLIPVDVRKSMHNGPEALDLQQS